MLKSRTKSNSGFGSSKIFVPFAPLRPHEGDKAESRRIARTTRQAGDEYDVEASLSVPETDPSSSEHLTRAKIIPKKTDPDLQHTHHELSPEDIFESMGVSGLCILADNTMERFTMISVAAQAFLVQYLFLWHMYDSLNSTAKNEEKIPRRVISAAIYLHFLNTLGEIPLVVAIMSTFCHFHDSLSGLLVTLPIFIIDAVCTPLLQLIIGSLFLCTSVSVVDVLLNSCAIAFISNIDNWILMLNLRVQHLGGYHDERHGRHEAIRIPYVMKSSKFIEWTFCLIPIIPAVFAITMTHIGIDIMRL